MKGLISQTVVHIFCRQIVEDKKWLFVSKIKFTIKQLEKQ